MENENDLKGTKLETLTAVFTQEGDSNSEDEFHDLTVEIDDAGGGPYFVIKTRRWAFDDIDSLIELLRKFEKHAKEMGVKFEE